MKMTRVLFAKMVELFSNQNDFDPSVLTNPDLLVATSPFAESPNLSIGDLTFASSVVLMRFKDVAVDAGLEVRVNPVTGDYEVAMLTLGPWEMARQFGGAPITAYGIALRSEVGLQPLLGYQTLPEPITFTAQAQAYPVADLTFRFPPSMVL